MEYNFTFLCERDEVLAMSYNTDVPDGATQRHSRMMELLTFVNINTPPGATITAIQSHMLKLYGLKFRTSSEMVQELAMSGALRVDGHGFYRLTEKQQNAFKTLVAQEKAQDMVGPLVRRIDRVEDDRTRQRLEALAAKLTELLEKTEEEEGSASA
jgi:hypothetical protein